MGKSWEKAQERCTDKEDRRRCVVQYVFDMDWAKEHRPKTKDQVQTVVESQRYEDDNEQQKDDECCCWVHRNNK